MAKACSVENTCHTAHFMNWLQRVFGTFLYDFPNNRKEVYESTVKPIEQLWVMMAKMIPGVRTDCIIDHPLNKFTQVSAMKFTDAYTDYYFGAECGEQVNYQKFNQGSTSTLWWYFKRGSGSFHVVFSFDMDISFTAGLDTGQYADLL